jgi:predicted enzyme related to lactoylglutathione lyase
MKIKLTTVYVNDQERALRFYTEVLGLTNSSSTSSSRVWWRCARCHWACGRSSEPSPGR